MDAYLADALSGAGMTLDQALRIANETMLDGNPSEHHVPYESLMSSECPLGDSDIVMVTKFHGTPDMAAVVVGGWRPRSGGMSFKAIVLDTGEEAFLRRDGVRLLCRYGGEDMPGWAVGAIKSAAESEAHYGPIRADREARINLCIQIEKYARATGQLP